MVARAGRFEVVRELARGGMGVVYVARDPALDRHVAVKVIARAALDPETLARFRTEARAAARLRHPNIVGVLEAGALPGGLPYLVMDLVEGESLVARLRRAGPLPGPEAARLFGSVARALEHAHARGVLHRDLKPANVLLDEAGAPFVADFGLARLVDGASRVTATGEVLGTPGYLAPEQAEGDRARIGPCTDVYGLGATLYEALTGRAPFAGLSGLAALEAVLAREPDPPTALRPGLDPALAAIAMRCLEKDPARRFTSAGQVADALEQWSRGRRPIRRRAAATLSAALVALVALVAMAGAAAAEVQRRGAVAEEQAARAAASAASARAASAREAAGRAADAERARGAALVTWSRAVDPARAVAALTSALAVVHAPADRADLLVRRALVRGPAGSTVDLDAAAALAPADPLLLAARVVLDPGGATLGKDEAARRLAALEPLARDLRGRDLAMLRAAIGRMHLQTGDVARAKQAADEAFALSPAAASTMKVRVSASLAAGARFDATSAAACLLHLAPEDPGAWAIAASVALRMGELELAIGRFDRALALDDTADVRGLRGQVRLLAGDLAGARADAARALELAPGHASAEELRRVAERLTAERRQAAIDVARRADPRDALATLAWTLDAVGDDLELRARLALVSAELEAYDRAAREADAVLAREPRHAVALVARAHVDLAAGRLDDARRRVEAALASAPTPEGHTLLARTCGDDARAARAAIEDALRLDPEHAAALEQRAALLQREGDLAAARRDAARATTLAPWRSTTWSLLAHILELGDPAGARAAADRCLALADDLPARVLRARLRLGADDAAGAYADAARAAALTASAAGLRDEAGARLGADPARAAALALARRGDPAEAEPALTRALGEGGDDVTLLAWRALVRARLGRAELALADADDVLRREPRQPVALAAQARVMASAAEAPDQEAARALLSALDQAIDGLSGAAEAYVAEGLVRSRSGDEDGALAAAERALRLEPDHVEALVLRAELLRAGPDVVRLRDDLRLATTLAPWHHRPWGLLALVGTRLQDRELIREASRECLLRRPDDVDARLARAALALMEQRPADALHDAEQVRAGGDGGPEALSLALEANVQLQRLPQAAVLGEALLRRTSPFDPVRPQLERRVRSLWGGR